MACNRELYVLDKDFTTICLMDAYISLVWTDRYDEYGDFELTVPYVQNNRYRTWGEISGSLWSAESSKIWQKVYFGDLEYGADYFAALQPDNYIYMPQSEHMMIIEKVDYQWDATNGMTCVASGRSLESILDRRIIWKHKSYSGKLFTKVRQVLDQNIIKPEESAPATYRRAIMPVTVDGITGFKAGFKFEMPYDMNQGILTWPNSGTFRPAVGNTYGSNADIYGPSSLTVSHKYTPLISVTEGDFINIYCSNERPNSTYHFSVATYNSSRKRIDVEDYSGSACNGRPIYTNDDSDDTDRYYQVGKNVAYVAFSAPDSEIADTSICIIPKTDASLYATVDDDFFGENVYDVITNWLNTNNLGFKIIFDWDNYNFIMSLYNGTDRTKDNAQNNQPIYFSVDLDNISESEYYKNYEVYYTEVLCGGEAANEYETYEGHTVKTGRKYASQCNHGTTLTYKCPYVNYKGVTTKGKWSTLDGLYRREYFVDASDISRSYERELTANEIKRIKRYHNNGLSNDDISKKMKITTSVVSNVLSKDYTGEYTTTVIYSEDEYIDKLISRAKDEYSDLDSVELLNMEWIGSDSYQYQQDFEVGDRVTYLDPFGNAGSARIKEWITSHDVNNGWKEYPTLDNDENKLEGESLW